jgi:hypothetical protein
MPRPISKLALTNCLDKHVNHRLRLFCVHQFYILCTPSLLLTFISYQHYYGYIRPCGWFVKHYYSLRVLRLLPCTLCPFVRSGVRCFKRFYLTMAHSTSTGSPVPPLRLSVSPGGFIPDAVNTSGNL